MRIIYKYTNANKQIVIIIVVSISIKKHRKYIKFHLVNTIIDIVVMYVTIEVTPQVNVEVIVIVIVQKTYHNKHQSIEESKHVSFTRGPYDDFSYNWLMKNGTPGGGRKTTYSRF